MIIFVAHFLFNIITKSFRFSDLYYQECARKNMLIYFVVFIYKKTRITFFIHPGDRILI